MAAISKAREELVDMYVKSLEEGKIPWEKMWKTKTPVNALSGKKYRGVNNLILSYIAIKRGYKDNRWCTFKTVAAKKWKLVDAKGHGVFIEYAGMKNKIDKKVYSFEEYNKIISQQPERADDFYFKSYSYKVFNADLIEGIDKYVDNTEKINNSEYVDSIIKNLDVKYKEEGEEAYYNLNNDEVVIPESNLFKSNYAYYATQLHELAHATGHKKRLARNMEGSFGSELYAKEELRAEISSSFLMQNLGLEYDDNHLNNHKAYVKNWLNIIKDKPQELFNAISDANKIVSYLESKSIRKEKDFELETEEEMEIDYA